MANPDRVDDRAFNANFTADGLERLKERVKDKLKEFIGDSTNEPLTEYVMLLLRNRRCKEEAKNGLNVFLGDDSDPFVSWLWDHLDVHLDLYVQPKEFQEEDPKTKLSSKVHAGNDVSQHLESEPERGKSSKLSISRRNTDWKGVTRGAAEPPLRSSEVDNAYFEEKARSKVNRSPDGQLKTKDVLKATMNAPQRLLQFAVRDAVATSGPFNVGTTVEPSLKRLHPMVSTPSGNSSVVQHPQVKQFVSRVKNPMATVVNATAEVAEDVMEIKSSRNVFDRLGRGMNPLDGDKQLGDNYTSREHDQSLYLQRSDYIGQHAANATLLDHDSGFLFDSTSGNECYDDVNAMNHQVTCASRISFSGGKRSEDEDSLMAQHGAIKNADDGVPVKRKRNQEQAAVASPNAFNGVPLKRRRNQEQAAAASPNASNGVPLKRRNEEQVAASAPNASNDVPLKRKRNQEQAAALTPNASNSVPLKRRRNQEKAAASAPNASNISVNVNTWGPQEYQESRVVAEADGHRKVDSETSATRSGLQLLRGNSKPLKSNNGNGNQAGDICRESQKILSATPGSTAFGRPLDDADSRTIFVSNVHFAATKDSLSRHFNKFGEVLKVIILTKTATGQPKGSAYVEFIQKEAADNALSLDGTSFMSRILKVVKKRAATVVSVPTMTWPRVMRGSPFPYARFSRVPFPRGTPFPNARFSRVPFPRGTPAFRPWRPIKLGARSMQWKRDGQGTSKNGASLNTGNVSVPFARSLTYIRTETKT